MILKARLNYHINCNCGKKSRSRYTGRGQNWAKGLTKETCESIKQTTEHLKEYYKTHTGTMTGRHQSPETKKQISEKLIQYNHSDNPRNLHSKGGWYDGIYHMSTWELAYYIYQKDHNIAINRCTDRFQYYYNNKKHFYTPDYIINDTYIEIKGREVEKDIYKYKAVEAVNKQIIVLYEKDIKLCINYVLDKYNIKKLTELYEKTA